MNLLKENSLEFWNWMNYIYGTMQDLGEWAKEEENKFSLIEKYQIDLKKKS